MKKLLLFMLFSLLFFAVGVNVGETEGKSPPGVEVGYYDLQPLAPAVSVEVEKPDYPVSVETTTIYTIHKTEAAVVRRHDRRLWPIYAKEVKSGRTTTKKRAFKTEYG